jgi:hypothetical protein
VEGIPHGRLGQSADSGFAQLRGASRARYNPPVLREGPIPLFLHGVIEYVAAGVLVVAPFLLGFDSDSATAVSIVAGVLVIFVAATTAGPTSLVNQVPLAVHILLDYVLAALLIAAPFLFGYSDETAPTAFFIALGVAYLLLAIATRYLGREPG